MKNPELVIMAAGLGSRYGGNKQVDRIGPDGEILMKYSVYDAIKAGFNKIVLIIKPEYRELLEDIFSDYIESGIEFCFAYQDFSSIPDIYKIPTERTKPFGTVHALLCAKDIIKEPFAVINADDFYGADAFKVMHAELVSLDNSKRAIMVAYSLKNTVSENGTVTRGICNVTNGVLSSIVETYDIAINDDGNIISDGALLDENLPTSMNMWGFYPSIFQKLDESFKAFLMNIKEGDIKAEYVLPSFVDEQIKTDSLEVSVLKTNSAWFGVTYKEDRVKVANRLLQMKESGEYPKNLSL